MAEDIRFSKKAATLTHASARGKVKRNAGNFTRGSQLFHHEILMTWAGIRMPLYVWVGTAILLLCALVSLTFKNHEVQLVLMKLYAEAWGWVQLNPNKPVNLTLPSGQMVQGTMSMVPYHPAVERACATTSQSSPTTAIGSWRRSAATRATRPARSKPSAKSRSRRSAAAARLASFDPQFPII